jgi:hypothetical protein
MALLKEKARLHELLHDTDHRVHQWLELTEKTFEFACSAQRWFSQGDSLIKRQILTSIASNLTLKDKKLRIDAKNPFRILAESIPYLLAKNRIFEPAKNDVSTTKNRALCPVRPMDLRGQDDVRTSGGIRQWRVVVQQLWRHVTGCRDECPTLLVALRQIVKAT